MHISAQPGRPVQPVKVVISGMEPTAGACLAALSTEVGKSNDLITLNYSTTNVAKGKDILNYLISAYNQDARMQINMASHNTSRFITERLKYLTVELSDVEKEVENYKQKNQLTDLSAEARLYMTRSSEYETKHVEAETQLKLVKYVEQFVRSRANANALMNSRAT